VTGYGLDVRGREFEASGATVYVVDVRSLDNALSIGTGFGLEVKIRDMLSRSS
jgi:hypothetical protein